MTPGWETLLRAAPSLFLQGFGAGLSSLNHTPLPVTLETGELLITVTTCFQQLTEHQAADYGF